MCGLFGAIGETINPGTIRALAVANIERGDDSLGFFSNSGKMCKQASPVLDCLAEPVFADYINGACTKGWFLAGHTRHTTHGNVTKRNAHPFRFGRIIGSHNGVVKYPKDRKYQVDSEYLFDQLKRHNGDYQAALADVSGYWGLSWFDGSDFYLQAHNNTIAYAYDDCGTCYYSSDETHLLACGDFRDEFGILADGGTLRFDCSGAVEELEPFVSNIKGQPSRADIMATRPSSDIRSNYSSDEEMLADFRAGCANGFNDPAELFSKECDPKDDWLNAADWDDYTKDFN